MVDLNVQSRFAPKTLAIMLSPRIRWLIAGLLVGVLLALGYTIRQPRDAGLTTLEGFYTPNVQYSSWYLANQYHIFDSQQGLPRVSNYTSGLNYGAIDYTFTYLNGASLVLSHSKDLQQIGALYLGTPWQGLILLPVAAFALYGWSCRIVSTPLRPAVIVVLYAFASLPNYPMISWASSGGVVPPLGWALFLGIYLAIGARHLDRGYTWQWAVVMIMCLLLIQPTYHTTALAITIFLVSLWLIQRRFIQYWVAQYLGQQGTKPSELTKPYLLTRSIQLTIVVFISFLLYHAVLLFNDYGRIFLRFLGDIYRSSDQERLKYSMTNANVSIWWHLANYAAVLVPLIWITLIVIRRRFQSERDATLTIYPLTWLAALGPLLILLFAWDGIFGVYSRVLQYGTLLSIASAALLLAIRPQAVRILGVAALVCVSISIFLTSNLDITASNYVTKDELAAATWIRDERGCESVVFTDFRIGPTMGYQGCFATIGPTATTLSKKNQIDQLADLLYNNNPQQLRDTVEQLSTTDNRHPNLILLSKRFLDPAIGFVLPDTRLRPMNIAQWDTYRAMPGWKVVFENDTAMVVSREP